MTTSILQFELAIIMLFISLFLIILAKAYRENNKATEPANPNTIDRLLERNCALVDQVNALEKQLDEQNEELRTCKLAMRLSGAFEDDAEDSELWDQARHMQGEFDNDPDLQKLFGGKNPLL